MSESTPPAPISICFLILTCCISNLAAAGPTYRYIDESYALVPGQTEATFSATDSNLPTDQGVHLISQDESRMSFAGHFRRSMDRNFTLSFDTIGIGLQQELVSAPGFIRGVEWKLGTYHRGKWGLKPEFKGSLKRIYSATWALVAQFNVFTFAPFDDGPSRLSLALTSGAIWQISDSWSVLTKMQIAVRDAVVRNLVYESNDEVYRRNDYEIALPLTFESRWRLSEIWDLSTEGSVRAIGYNIQKENYEVQLSLRAKW